MKSVTSSCIFEFLEIIVPQCSQERPVSGPRNYFDARHAVPGTALSNVTRERDSRDKPFLPFTPPLSSYDSKRLSTGRQRPTQAQLEVSGRPTLLWMDGPTSAVQYQKVDVAILFQPPPISSVLWPRSICTAVWKYALFEIRNTNFSLAARFRVDVRDENVGRRRREGGFVERDRLE